MPKVKIIGATGYGGLGLIEIILRHPEFKLTAIAATQDINSPLTKVWSYLEGYCDLKILDPQSSEFNDIPADVTVCATPDGVGQIYANRELNAGRKFLDYSGDYRFNSASLYEEYAKRINKDPEHKTVNLLNKTVYGLPELHRTQIKNSNLIGNPGCFAASCILALAPAIKHKLIDLDMIFCDCKSGISGAGKKATLIHHYPERYDNMQAYRLSGHQHVMEIEHELSKLAGEKLKITFTPQVVPLCRGIMSCVYGKMTSGNNQKKVLEVYKEFYDNEFFIKIKDSNAPVSTNDVRGSNRCIITVACDDRTGSFRVISHIDNLMKGQAGSAAQNLNIMFGISETAGLNLPGSHP